MWLVHVCCWMASFQKLKLFPAVAQQYISLSQGQQNTRMSSGAKGINKRCTQDIVGGLKNLCFTQANRSGWELPTCPKLWQQVWLEKDVEPVIYLYSSKAEGTELLLLFSWECHLFSGIIAFLQLQSSVFDHIKFLWNLIWLCVVLVKKTRSQQCSLQCV